MLDAHVEWMVAPAMQLLRSLSELSQPGALEGPLTALLHLSPLERAAAVGQQAFLDAKSRSDEVEPGRLDPCSLHGVRGWFRQTKELVRSPADCSLGGHPRTRMHYTAALGTLTWLRACVPGTLSRCRWNVRSCRSWSAALASLFL